MTNEAAMFGMVESAAHGSWAAAFFCAAIFGAVLALCMTKYRFFVLVVVVGASASAQYTLPDYFWRNETLPFKPVVYGTWTANPSWDLYIPIMESRGWYFPTHAVVGAPMFDPTTGQGFWNVPVWVHESGNFVLAYTAYGGLSASGTKTWKIMMAHQTPSGLEVIPNTALLTKSSANMSTLPGQWYRGLGGSRTSTLLVDPATSLGSLQWLAANDSHDDPWIKQKTQELLAQGHGTFDYRWNVRTAQWETSNFYNSNDPGAIIGGWSSAMSNDTWGWVDYGQSSDPNSGYTGWYFDYMAEQWRYRPSDSQTDIIGPAEWYLSEIEQDTGIMVSQQVRQESIMEGILSELQAGQLEDISRSLRNMESNAPNVLVTNINSVTVNVDGSGGGTGGTVNVDMSGVESRLEGEGVADTGTVGDSSGDGGSNWVSGAGSSTGALAVAQLGTLDGLSSIGSKVKTLKDAVLTAFTVTVDSDWTTLSFTLPLSGIGYGSVNPFSDYEVSIVLADYEWLFTMIRLVGVCGLYVWGFGRLLVLAGWALS